MKEVIDTYCGLSCANCEYREKCNCGGCIATEGHPFHGECEVAECAKKNKRPFCGECVDFPCEIITRYSNDEKNGDTPKGARIERCRALKAELVREAREGLDPVAYCGFHCDNCFLGQWCGGCRSDYNCCSFATLYEDGKCPNVTCCQEKGLEGCYDCDELDGCMKGYYSKEDEFMAKATALFIRKYGKECYSGAITRANADEAKFNESKSVDDVFKLIEKYIEE